MAAGQDRWGLVYSEKTGLQFKKRLRKILAYLNNKNIQYDLVHSDDKDSVEKLTRMLCNNAYKTVVVIGGDGTINDALNGIMTSDFLHKDFAFGIIPSGSANDFIRFWGVQPNDYKYAIDAIVKRNVRKIDVGVFTFVKERKDARRYFLNCVNFGLGAKLIELANSTKVLTGSQRFSNLITIISQIFQRKSYKIQFLTDSETFNNNVMSVCVGNTFGYGQTPNAVPYNGMLDMSVISRPEWWQLFQGFWLLGKGRFLNYKNVHPYRIESARFTDIGKAKVSLDGRILQYKNVTPVTVNIIKENLPFIIP